MRTDELITRLSADQVRRGSPLLALALATAAAFVLAGLAMMLSIGPRPDLGQAAGAWRFEMKVVVMLALSATTFVLLRRALYPEGLDRAPLWIVLAAPALLLVMVLGELMLLPLNTWGAAARGTNWAWCLVLVPSFGILPLAAVLRAIRQGATTRPVLAGFLGGLLAGGAAATAYALHCPDDSPLFVAIWYPLGILALACAGALLGGRVLRW